MVAGGEGLLVSEMKDVIERQRLLMVRQAATVGQIANLLADLQGVKEVRVVELKGKKKQTEVCATHR
jgi:hypothetical protein